MKHPVSSGVTAPALHVQKGAETALQVLELASFFHDTIFVMAKIFLTCTALSAPIYKICTLLSTGFVENPQVRPGPSPRKPLPDADFGGASPSSL
jgi:hypothetical protein